MIDQYTKSIEDATFLRKFDMFSQPFQHRVDYNQKTKKTSLGGFLSIIIVIIALLYLAYVLYLFFNGDYTPAISTTVASEEGLFSYDINFSPFAFTFRNDNSIVTNWQDDFAVEMYLDNNGSDPDTAPFKIVKCSDVIPEFGNIADHYCIDTNSTPNVSLSTNQSNPGEDMLFNFVLRRSSTSTNTDTILKQSSFVMELVFIYQRYDTSTRSLKKIIERENIMIDPALFIADIYQVTQTELKVDTGFLLASWETTNFISEFKKSQSVITSAFIQAKYGTYKNASDLLKMTQIQLMDKKISTTIEFPKIAFVLAQFQSIFSTLLIIGVLAKMGSENRNIEENIDTIMNNYYKETALEIDQFLEQKKSQKKQQNLQDTRNPKVGVATVKDRTEEIKENGTIKNRLFNLYQFKLLKHFMQDGDKIDEEKEDIQLKSFKKAIKKSWSLMNAHQMHLEMLRTKTALQLLLSEKQYAALDFVSRRMHPDPSNINHLEQQDRIDDDQELRTKKAIEYFEELQMKPPSVKPDNNLDEKFKNCFLKGVFARNKDALQEEELDILDPNSHSVRQDAQKVFIQDLEAQNKYNS